MDYKNILVVYYSRSGDSRKVAGEIAQGLGCDLQEIISTTTYPMGFWGFQKAIVHSIRNKRPVINIGDRQLSKYDLVVVGGPMWAGLPALPVQTFLEDYGSQIKNLAFFNTQAGNTGRDKLMGKMKELCGKSPVAILSVTGKEFQDGSYKKNLNSFIVNIKPKEQERSSRRPPESQASI